MLDAQEHQQNVAECWIEKRYITSIGWLIFAKCQQTSLLL